MSTITVKSVNELVDIIKASQHVHVFGNGSKTGLTTGLNIAYSDAVQRVQLTGLIGITEYQPEEYTITAQAGTPVKVMQEALAKNGQYLPFDPMLADTATIGGTVATNLSGSRRFRYGGVRDFILGATVVDGQGRSFRVGGKVVKNSAGFDLTKFLVGSLGLYAIMTSVTFKVFPDVPDFTTLKLRFDVLGDLLKAIYFLNQSVFELDALDFQPIGNGWTLWARMTGLANTLSARVERLVGVLRDKTRLQAAEEMHGDNSVWDAHNSLSWADGLSVVKVTISPKRISKLDGKLSTMQRRYSVGGNVAWIATGDIDKLNTILTEQDLTGLCVLGDSSNGIIGKPIDNPLSDRVKMIFDPENKLV